MADVIKRRITGVSADTVGAKIDMANIAPASFPHHSRRLPLLVRPLH